MAESHELVTVVVSVFNIETQLPKCLDSISTQTYRNLEILLIDDGSTDGSGRLCDEFAVKDSRVRVIHQENQGPWAVRNRGVEEAKGEYLVFPDGDDYFHKDYVRLLYEAINLEGKEYPLAICDYKKVLTYDEDTISESCSSFKEIDHSSLVDALLNYPSCWSTYWGANWNKIYRKSALPQPFQKDYLRCQDWESNLRFFFQAASAVSVSKVLYYWFQWPGQRTRSKDDLLIRNECRTRIYLDNLLDLPEHLSDYSPFLLTNVYRRLIYWKDCVRHSEEQEVAFKQIRKLEKKAFPYLFSCKQVPFRRKVRWMLSLHSPFLLQLFGKRVRLEPA